MPNKNFENAILGRTSNGNKDKKKKKQQDFVSNPDTSKGGFNVTGVTDSGAIKSEGRAPVDFLKPKTKKRTEGLKKGVFGVKLKQTKNR